MFKPMHARDTIMYYYTVWLENFGELVVLRAICRYFHPPNTLQYGVITAYTLLHGVINMYPPPFIMSTRKLQTSKEWNKTSLDLVYHQLVPAQFIYCGSKWIQQC